MKANNWLALLSFVLGLGAAAAQPKPYQLCQKDGPVQRPIEINYRYPPSQTNRTVEALVGEQCDLPVVSVQSGCPWGYPGNCGQHDQELDHCGDGPGWWVDVDVFRSKHWRSFAPGSTPSPQRWPNNLDIEIHQGFPVVYRSDRYRTWFWDLPLAHHTLLGTFETMYPTREFPRCYTMAHLLGFFNGVWNTKREAEQSLEVMKQQSFLGPDWRGAPIRYELFYNQSCKRDAADSCLQDVAEVFRQRSSEIDGLLARRWEYFWEQVTGQHAHAGSFTQRLVSRAVRSDNALAKWFDALGNALLAKITALSTLLVQNPPTAQDAAGHTAQLIRAGQRAERAVLVAHSQGNLFVNAAYDAYLAHSRQAGALVGEDTGYVAAKVVHIAPASPTLRGPYVLASSDLVINGLRRVDGTYLPVSNESLPLDRKDPSGHKLLDTYLDEARPLRARVRQLVTDALDAL
jgi:hypothetical protein